MFPLLFRVAVQTSSRHRPRAWRVCASIRFDSNAAARRTDNEAENVNVGHSRFLAESSRHSQWRDDSKVPTGVGGLDNPSDEGSDIDAVQSGKGACIACFAFSGLELPGNFVDDVRRRIEQCRIDTLPDRMGLQG